MCLKDLLHDSALEGVVRFVLSLIERVLEFRVGDEARPGVRVKVKVRFTVRVCSKVVPNRKSYSNWEIDDALIIIEIVKYSTALFGSGPLLAVIFAFQDG